ncbi:MAG TPA: DUF4340 domain-containing protein, partial [Candidatus Limnocylindrales bacterium]|nr:DUF4340 domain-containing protein [Candidatus Limnocylindrales bacterium]
SKTTVIWFVLAAALFAFIWIFEHYFQPAAPEISSLLPGLRASAVTGIQISPAGAPEISVIRSNGVWQLEKPIAYSAQAAGIETLLVAVEKLVPVLRLTAGDLRAHQNADREFGFENPQFFVAIQTGEQSWQLRVGNKTAPGDGVYVRVVGGDGAFVTDTAWLQLLPHSAGDWRDTALVDAAGVCDWIVITNGAKAIELRRDPTNHLWHMIRPSPAGRADSLRITAALQQLRTARVTQFVSDDPKADLAAFGLQPAELDVWLGRGTNYFTAVHAGKNSPENPAQIFVRREGSGAVLATAKESLLPWRGSVNDFRDPQLFELTAPVAEIEVRGETNSAGFVLQLSGANSWSVVGEKFPADADNVQAFVRLLAGFRVGEFVKDVVTGPDLQGFGLVAPSRQITLRTVAGDTNRVLAQLLFGATETNKVFVKRADEDFVYALAAEDLNRLPESGWEFRDRRIWSFSETNVAQVTLRQNGKTRQMIRTGENKWSLAPGSQGIITPSAIEETVHRLGELTAFYWFGRNLIEPEKNYGLNPDNLSITIDLKTGEKMAVDFGTEIPKAQTALAAVTLQGERWAFVFPPPLYQLVAAYLTIPPDAP